MVLYQNNLKRILQNHDGRSVNFKLKYKILINGKTFQQAYHATTVIRQMQRMALSSGGSGGGGGGKSPTPQRSMSTSEPCGSFNGAQDKQKEYINIKVKNRQTYTYIIYNYTYAN